MNPRLVEIAKALAREYFLPSGGDQDDLLQEALIGVMEAERDFDTSYGVNLETFARFVIRRKLISAIKAANRDKHLAHNEASSIDLIVDHARTEQLPLHETIAGREPDPLDRVIFMEAVAEAVRVIEGMSPLQQAAFKHVINGGSYEADKQIDNAMVRARRRISFLREVA